MLPANSVVVIFLSSMLWLTSTLGRVVSDDEQDTDEDWPVLCPPDTFYSRQQELCLACSRCPLNNIITSPCNGFYDTKCGPFYDFQKFISADELPNVANDNNISENQNDDSEDFPDNKSNSKDSAKNIDYILNRKESKVRQSNLVETSSDNLEYSNSEWKSLTIVLIVLVSIFLFVVIVCVVHILRKRIITENKIVYEYSPAPENV